METATTMATKKKGATPVTDQDFTVVTNKPEGVRKGPGRPRKEKIPTTTITTATATPKNNVRSQALTSSTPNVTAIPREDGENYFT
ncbi:hypothetical protein K3495_g16705 [Podosphaera aphanis]|nr:hypothetical protein K3495_g16705 [Podosphaera aphanis]